MIGWFASDFQTAIRAVGILIHPNGNFAYVLNRTGNSINEYSLDARAGNLTALGSQVTLTGAGLPLEFSIDAGGNFIYVSHGSSSQVEQVAVNSSSELPAPCLVLGMVQGESRFRPISFLRTRPTIPRPR